MHLLSHPTTNLLPMDGEAYYFPNFIPEAICAQLYQQLLDEIEWQQDEAFIYGKHYITKRKVAWYGTAPYAYTYSRTTKIARPFTPLLSSLQHQLEGLHQAAYNSCLLNLYHNGQEGMAYHSDNEPCLLPLGAIGSITLGATRKFCFKHKDSKQTLSLTLENGSALIMTGATQQHWLHALPKSTKITTGRINLTFRHMLANSIGHMPLVVE